MTSGDDRAAAARVLIAEDEKHLALLLEHFLVGRGHTVDVVHDGREALARLTASPYDVALLDVQMPLLDGLAVLRGVRALPLPPQVIVMTGNGTIDTALAAMETGAYDYVAKPYRMAEVELLVRRAAERRRLEGIAIGAETMLDAEEPLTRWAPLRAVLDLVARSAPSLGAMLVHGEPGTGRARLARWTHALAGGGPFVTLDAARVALCVGAARGGTLHVPNVDALASSVQRAIADALDDVTSTLRRVIASTARRPDALSLDARLFAHVSTVVVELPPLRDREGDVAALTDAFVRRFGGPSPAMVTAAALAHLERQPWLGNVAELKLGIERAVAQADDGVIDIEHVLPNDQTPAPAP